jgi:hypothetical protein
LRLQVEPRIPFDMSFGSHAVPPSRFVAAALLVLISILCIPLSLPAQEPGLSTMTDASFTKWLTGTEWKGEKDGKRAHLWFATPGIIIWRWEYNPGVWDCRAASLIVSGKGKVKWRWNAESVASCSVVVSEDLKSAALEDRLLGKWTLQPSARKNATVSGGRLATTGASGFTAWVERQSLLWRADKLNFTKGRAVAYEKGPKGKFAIVSTGVVEVLFETSPADCLLIIFTPGLDGALVYAPWGVTGARVKGAPATGVPPAPVFNDPEPPLKTLPSMKKEDFEKWLVGTEWEHTDTAGACWHWFATPGMVTRRNSKEQLGWGMNVLAPGKMRWNPRVDMNRQLDMELDSNLTGGEIRWAEEKYKIRLVARRSPFPMTSPRAEEMGEILAGWKSPVGNGAYVTYFPSSNKAVWNSSDGKKHDLNLTIAAPGTALWSWPETKSDSAMLVFRTPALARICWRWNTTDLSLEKVPVSTGGASSSAGLFDMELKDTKPVPMKKQAAAVNALVVISLDGARTAGGLSKLSLTSLPVTNEDAATIKFNQPVGSDMNKALREVIRFHAIRQGGWPRGQRIELSFADKYSPKDGPSAAVACALLLESTLTGKTVSPEFAVTGDMNADGSVQPIGGVAAKLRGATKGGCTRVAIPAKNTVQAADLALTDGAAPFLGIQVFSVDTFDEAAKLAAGDDPALQAVLDTFSAIAKKIKADGASLRQPATIEALRQLAVQSPNHLSARYLLAIAENKLPPALSPPGSVTAINLAIVDALESTSQELLARSNLDRGKVAAARSRLQQVRTKLDKRTLPLADAWIAWSNAIDRLTAAAAGGGRVEARFINELKTAAARIQNEESRLSSDAEFNEDLLK